MLQAEEAVRRAVADLATDVDRQAFALQMVDDRLHAVAPGDLQDLRIEQKVRELAEQVTGDPAAGGQVAVHADQSESVVFDRGPVMFDDLAQLVILEIAVQGGLGDLGLLLLVRQAREQADLLESQPALAQRLQHGGVDRREGLKPLDLQFRVAEGCGDGLGIHPGLPQFADGRDDVGDVNWRVLGVRQHDGGRLLRLGLGQQAVDQVVVVEVAAVTQHQQAQTPTTAIEGHEGLLALLPGPNDRRDHHAGGVDGLSQLRHAVIGRLIEAEVLLGKPKVAQADLNAGHGGERGGLCVSHRDQAPAPGRGSSCPWARPARPFLPPPHGHGGGPTPSGAASPVVPVPPGRRRQGHGGGETGPQEPSTQPVRGSLAVPSAIAGDEHPRHAGRW